MNEFNEIEKLLDRKVIIKTSKLKGKVITEVHNLHLFEISKDDIVKLSKIYKKLCNCGCTLREEKDEINYYLELQGNHVETVKTYLTEILKINSKDIKKN